MRQKTSFTKRLLAFLTAAAIAVSVTGCGSRANNSASNEAPSTSQSQSSESEANKADSEATDDNKASTEEKDSTSGNTEEGESAESTVPDISTSKSDTSNSANNSSSSSSSTSTTSVSTSSNNMNSAPSVPTRGPVHVSAPAPAAVTPASTTSEQQNNTNTSADSTSSHTYSVRHHDATCTGRGYDEHICHEDASLSYDDNFTNALGHDWDDGVVTKLATQTESGIRTYTCRRCGESFTEEIPEMTKHFRVKEVIAPTCTSDGYTIYECIEVPEITYKADFVPTIPHIWDDGVITKEATIYEPGEKTYTCTVCGEVYTETIPAAEKTWHKGDAVEPTCEEDGYTIYICDQDENLTEKRDVIPALGHDWDDGAVIKEATCTEDGEIIYTCSRDGETKLEVIPASGHDWDEGTTIKEATYEENGEIEYTCKTCGETKTEIIPALNYTFTTTIIEPTCTEQGYTHHECNEDPSKSYDDSYVDALGHDWDDGVITKVPTCAEEGEKTFTCKHDNNHTYTEPIAKTEEHAWDDGVVTKEPTATEPGIRTYTCTVCGETKEESISHLNHVWDDGKVTREATCEEDGEKVYHCTVDGCTETKVEVIPALGHQWETGSFTKQPTCTEGGEYVYVCSRDSSHTMVNQIPPLEHSWDDGVVTTEPTQENDGVKTFTCKVCGETKTEPIPALKYTFTVTVVEPTCTEQGYTLHKCNENDAYSYKDNYVASTGHSGSVHTVDATCGQDGYNEFVCSKCGFTQVISTIPKTGNHSWDDGVVTTEPTESSEGVKTYTCTVCGETKTESIPALSPQSIAEEHVVIVDLVPAEIETAPETLPSEASESPIAEDIVAANRTYNPVAVDAYGVVPVAEETDADAQEDNEPHSEGDQTPSENAVLPKEIINCIIEIEEASE